MDYVTTYPRIAQLLPAHNIWLKYKGLNEDGSDGYTRAVSLALIEYIEQNKNENEYYESQIHQKLVYIDFIDMDSLDLNDVPSANFIEYIYSETDPNMVQAGIKFQSELMRLKDELEAKLDEQGRLNNVE